MNNTLKSLIATGFAISVTLPVFAADAKGKAAQTDHAGRIKNLSPEEHNDREWMREEWKNMTPEQRTKKRSAMREHWENMPAEERRDMRDQMKENWQKMSPEERDARRNEMREHWQNMSPEEREKFKNVINGTDAISPIYDHTEGLSDHVVPK